MWLHHAAHSHCLPAQAPRALLPVMRPHQSTSTQTHPGGPPHANPKPLAGDLGSATWQAATTSVLCTLAAQAVESLEARVDLRLDVLAVLCCLTSRQLLSDNPG